MPFSRKPNVHASSGVVQSYAYALMSGVVTAVLATLLAFRLRPSDRTAAP